MSDFERGARKALEEFKLYLCDEHEYFWPENNYLEELEFDMFTEQCLSGVLWEENNVN